MRRNDRTPREVTQTRSSTIVPTKNGLPTGRWYSLVETDRRSVQREQSHRKTSLSA